MPRHSRGKFFEDLLPFIDNSGPHSRHRAPGPLPRNEVLLLSLRAEYLALGITPPPSLRPAPRFRIHKRKGQLKRARSTPWHLQDRATGKGYLVNSWRGALELAKAVTR